MLLIDLSHTSHTTAQTGIQRVCRSLHAELSRAKSVQAITYDPYHYGWRSLANWEHANLTSSMPARIRGARWPLAARLVGRARYLFTNARSQLDQATALVVPEVFSPQIAAHLPQLFAMVSGPRVALFHDAIALKYPELTPRKTVARFPAYLQELLAFDGIAAVSEDSRLSLIDYWKWLGISPLPPVQALTLPLTRPIMARAATRLSPSKTPTVLSVGSIEGRKNHIALLDACEQLWRQGVVFTLRLIGMGHPQTGRIALERIRTLKAEGRPIHYDGPADEETLERAYTECTFTVYPSIMEGFGLPVLESLAHSKPCVCSARGALGESARGGGCRALESVDPASLAHAIDALLQNEPLRRELSAEAGRRTFRAWPDYTGELVAWMAELPRH